MCCVNLANSYSFSKTLFICRFLRLSRLLNRVSVLLLYLVQIMLSCIFYLINIHTRLLHMRHFSRGWESVIKQMKSLSHGAYNCPKIVSLSVSFIGPQAPPISGVSFASTCPESLCCCLAYCGSAINFWQINGKKNWRKEKDWCDDVREGVSNYISNYKFLSLPLPGPGNTNPCTSLLTSPGCCWLRPTTVASVTLGWEPEQACRIVQLPLKPPLAAQSCAVLVTLFTFWALGL